MLYEGSAFLITVPGILGNLGFMPHYASYITGLKKGEIKIYTKKDDSTPFKIFSIKRGHAYFNNNHCLLCIHPYS